MFSAEFPSTMTVTTTRTKTARPAGLSKTGGRTT
ncbi:MAG: hypothetical protein JWL93_1116 [Hyphomicrobiales bacterium]|nr:hypothetical protein [Hyphomicrobiales bacterium]